MPRSAYVHVPFCAHRCGYCDFTLIAGRDDLIGDYLRALEVEISSTNIDELDTLFLGGGTPTHPSCEQLQELFRIIFRRFHLGAECEVSIEANPLDLTDRKIALLSEFGVNRISLGIQSFSQNSLKLLERDHTVDDIQHTVLRLKNHFANISFDLIFGVPGQSIDGWKTTLEQAISLKPTHISTYGLTWESGTAFGTRKDRGELTPVDEEIEREQYAMAMELLSAAGFEHYEISNFALPGYRCRHNEMYWAGREYWAFGPGAARYVSGRRETNIRSVLGWLSRMERNESPVADAEELDATHRAKELVFLGLRRTEGINREDFRRDSGIQLDELASEAISLNLKRGWIEDTGKSIRLTYEGRFVADRVVAEFL